MNRQRNNLFDAFLDGFTGAGLFARLRWPGAPTEVIDTRDVDDLYQSGEFYANVRFFERTLSPVEIRQARQQLFQGGSRPGHDMVGQAEEVAESPSAGAWAIGPSSRH